METDTLSEVLRAVRLRGAIFFDVRATSPWMEESPEGAEIASPALDGAPHVISFHAVAEGACWVEVEGHPPVRLEQGDIIVLPQGDAHVLGSAPGLKDPADITAHVEAARRGPLPVPVSGGGGGPERVRLVCGFLGCERVPFNPLLAALPRVVVVRDGEHGARSLLPLVRLALQESGERRSGGHAVLARLSELLFLEAIRRHVEELPAEHAGWLAGLRDPHVGRALAALHARPAAAWTLAALAREAGLSRSALAERFAAFVGQPPMQYLLRWRLQLAAGLLMEGAKVAAAAEEVGYDSEAAFSRAFKRLAGVPPSGWKERQAAAAREACRAGAERAPRQERRPPVRATSSA